MPLMDFSTSRASIARGAGEINDLWFMIAGELKTPSMLEIKVMKRTAKFIVASFRKWMAYFRVAKVGRYL